MLHICHDNEEVKLYLFRSSWFSVQYRLSSLVVLGYHGSGKRRQSTLVSKRQVQRRMGQEEGDYRVVLVLDGNVQRSLPLYVLHQHSRQMQQTTQGRYLHIICLLYQQQSSNITKERWGNTLLHHYSLSGIDMN